MIRASPTSRPHIYIVVFCDTPNNPDAFFHDLMCLCACRDYPKVEQKLQCFSDRMASIPWGVTCLIKSFRSSMVHLEGMPNFFGIFSSERVTNKFMLAWHVPPIYHLVFYQWCIITQLVQHMKIDDYTLTLC